MPFKFPFTNYHELNLDWIIKKIEEITKIFEESSETITIYEERLADAEQDAADALAAAGSAVNTATQADTAASAASTAASAASAAAAQAQIRAGQAEAAADAAQQTATAAQIAAANAESIVQNFVITPSNFTIEPDIYTVTYDPNNTTVSPASIVFYSYVFIGGVKSPYTAAKLTAYAVHDGLTMPASQVDALDASSLTFPVPAYLDKDDYIVVKAFKSPEAYVYQEVAYLTVPVIADGEKGQDGEVQSEVIAPDFNVTYDYYTGNYVWYNGKLYKFNTDHTAGAWNSSEADEVCVAWEIENNYADFKQFVDDAVPYILETHNNKAPVIISSASGAIASFPDGADQLPIEEIICSIEPVQAGSGDPSPDNVRPISGHTGVTVTQTGENMIPTSVPSNVIAGTFGTSSTSIESATNARVLAIPVPKNADIYVQKKAGNTNGHSIALGDTGNIAVGTPLYDPVGFTNFRDNAYNTGEHTWLYVGSPSLANAEDLFTTTEFMVSLGTERKDYVAPTGSNTYSVTFPDSAGTVYGGTLTLRMDESGVWSGEIVVDRAEVTLDETNSWTMYVEGKFFVNNVTSGAKSRTNVQGYLSNTYRFAGNGDTNSVSVTTDKRFYGQKTFNRIWVYDSQYTTLDAFETALESNPLQVVYPLETPITIPLTAEHVGEIITTFYGANNVWADTGNVSLRYRADTKLYIERLTIPDDVDMIADTNIASGKFFMVGNDLYLSTAAIAAGAQITVGTNATRLSLADALNQINT